MSTIQAWRVVRHGRPPWRWRSQQVAEPVPGPGEARIPCSRQRLQLQRGRRLLRPLPHDRSAAPYTLGMECAGVVDAVGPGAEAWLGRRVSACAVGATGAHAQRARRPGDDLRRTRALDDVDACAFFFPFHVALAGALRARAAPARRVAARARGRGRRGLGRRPARRRRRRARDRDGRLRGEARILPRARRRARARLPARRLAGALLEATGGRGRGRRLRPGRRRRHPARPCPPWRAAAAW